VKGYGDFKVVGGTGAFRGAKGLVFVEVTAVGMTPEGGIVFTYAFDGYLDLPPRR
jgi:hypothetical protein